MRKPRVADLCRKAQLPRAERLILEPQLAVGGVVAVLGITQNRAADVAKCIRMRFEQNQIDFLLKLKWWNMDEEWIRSNSLLFSDVNCLMEKYGISL